MIAACQCHWICSPLSRASSSAASDIADDLRGINSEQWGRQDGKFISGSLS